MHRRARQAIRLRRKIPCYSSVTLTAFHPCIFGIYLAHWWWYILYFFLCSCGCSCSIWGIPRIWFPKVSLWNWFLCLHTQEIMTFLHPNGCTTKRRVNSFKCLTILTSNYICAYYVQAGIPALRRRPLHRCLLPKCVEPAQHLALDMSDRDSRCSCTSFLSPCFTYIYTHVYIYIYIYIYIIIYKSQMIWICCSKVVCQKGL